MQVGDRIIVKIEKLLFGGRGLAHEDRYVIFIPGGIPGEKVHVEITAIKKGYAEGRILEVIDPSPYRQTPPCPIFWECGGCDLQHITDPMQLQYKAETLRDLLIRISKLRSIPLAAPIPSPEPIGYRFRVQLTVQEGTMGFYQRGSHKIVKVTRCPISSPLINNALALLSQLIEKGGSWVSILQWVQIQVSENPEQILVTFFLKRFNPIPFEPIFQSLKKMLPIVGLVLRAGKRCQILGQVNVTLFLLGEKLRVSDISFAQANWHLNERMVSWVLEKLAIQKEDRILEIYSGIGNFTIPFARRAASVVAVEANRNAVEDASINIKDASLTNVRLVKGSAERFIPKLKEDFDLIFIDPPRSGAEMIVLQSFPQTARRLVYLSCNPPTLARDLRLLLDKGWSLSMLQPFDMFPQTAHLEVGAVLDRN